MTSNLLTEDPYASQKEAIKLIKALKDYLPSHLYHQIELSFQFPQSSNINDFKTYTYNKEAKCFKIVDTKQGHLTKHTHLTRDIKRREDGVLYYGYNYIHWKSKNQKDPSLEQRSQALVPFYVGESASPTKSDYFRRSCEKRNQSKQEGLLQWQKEAEEGYITWIINRVPFQQNLQLEEFLIAFYGRHDLGKGPLVNRNNGGRSGSGNWGPTISESITGVPKKTSICAYCGVEQAIENITKFHNENCINRPGYVTINEELQALFPHEVGSRKTWAEVNKAKQDTFYENNTEQWKKSRNNLRMWVLNTCKDKTEKEKLQLGFFKTIKNKPKSSSSWRSVAFFLKGQWYTIYDKKARKSILSTKPSSQKL